jgi:hypothetical protein
MKKESNANALDSFFTNVLLIFCTFFILRVFMAYLKKTNRTIERKQNPELLPDWRCIVFGLPRFFHESYGKIES